MPITYDITKDFAYKKGEEVGEKRGEKKGERRGEKQGMKKREHDLLSNMISSGQMTLEQIAQVTQVPLGEVEKIARELGKQ